MPQITIIYGEDTKTLQVEPGSLVGEAIAASGLPLEQPCAGRGTCGKCNILVEAGVAEPDEIEREHLSQGELALNNRLACRARVGSDEDVRIILAPVVVYSNKIFRASHRYKRTESPLGLAIDLGTTTVAAFLTMLDNGEVCAGGASLNQQAVYGADVISRLAAATMTPFAAERLHRLALSSINQAVDSLNLPDRIKRRIERVTIVGNVAMHHLLARLPVDTLAVSPFQPFDREAILDGRELMGGILDKNVTVMLPPLIGGFVGSDALACLAHFGFDHADGPLVAIDLGTNGEVLVTDGNRILTASTAAGPAFEGVLISCGTRAIDGAIVSARIEGTELVFTTIASGPPVGLTGSGLLSLTYELVKAGVIAPNGRLSSEPPILKDRLGVDRHGTRRLLLTPGDHIALTQWDIRELQKAKAAVRAAVDILMERLDLKYRDIQRLILTGSFGAQVDIDAVLGIGMIPPVRPQIIETIANGAGFGAASFLSDEGFVQAQELAIRAEQIDLDHDSNFIPRFIRAMQLSA